MSTSAPRILIAGIGNVFFGDDGFGVEVARRLALRPLPAGVRVVDFGIRVMDLACALLDPYEAVLIVDAVRGDQPGRSRVILLDDPPSEAGSPPHATGELHSLNPAEIVQLARTLGRRIGPIVLVGCESRQSAAAQRPGVPMSQPVQAAVAEVAGLVERLVEHLHSSHLASDGDFRTSLERFAELHAHSP